MTFIEAKEKLHGYIDQLDEQKVIEILSLFESDEKKDHQFYNEAVLAMLRERRLVHVRNSKLMQPLNITMQSSWTW